MAASLLGGAAVGAVFGELLSAVLEMTDKAIMFKPTFAYLQSALIAIDPVIKEIQHHNNQLGRPNEELESLITQMEEGKKLVYKCSNISKLNFVARIRCQEQLEALRDYLLRFFTIDMQAQTARDSKETLYEVKRLRSAINKLHLSPDSAPVPKDLSETEIRNDDDENEMETDPTEEATESETLQSTSTQPAKDAAGTNSDKQVMKDITTHLRNFSQVPSRQRYFVGFGRSCRFDLEDVLSGSAEVLGRKMWGTSYKTTLNNGRTVFVKRLKGVNVGKEEFERRMKIAHMVSQHPNVMPLLACYYSIDEKLLIYDYVAAGSFSTLLHGPSETGRSPSDRDSRTSETGRSPFLDWYSRMKISLGAAKGIAHIHSRSFNEGVHVHGNISSSNVLVTSCDRGACISDLAITFPINDFNYMVSNAYGYQAPELIHGDRVATRESDVYSFGALLFEMLTGKSPWHMDTLKWVEHVAGKGRTSLAARKRHTFVVFDQSIPGNNRYCMQMLQVAESCVQKNPTFRPSMDEVVTKMEQVMASVKLQRIRFFYDPALDGDLSFFGGIDGS